MICLAPGCKAETESKYHELCTVYIEYVERAMADHKDRLLWAMPEARQDVDTWLASEWVPALAWAFAGEDYQPVPVEQVAADLAENVSDEYGACVLGFFDPAREKWRGDQGLVERHSLWRVIESSTGTVAAWRAHLEPLLQGALTEALKTFPLAHAGAEIKAALLQQHGYGTDATDGAIGEVCGELLVGSQAPLSDDADTYVRLRYDTDPSYLFHADDPDEIWFRHRVLPDDVMAILEAVRAHDAEQEADESMTS